MHKKGDLIAVLAVILLLPSVGIAEQLVHWEATLDAAQRSAGQSNRLVLIHFWAPWCVVCKRMEAEVLNQPAVAAELASHYVTVKINADHFPATAQQYGVTALPTTVITTPAGQLVDSMRGRVNPDEFMARLSRVAAEAKQRSGAVYAQVPPGAVAPAVPAQSAAAQNPPPAATVVNSPPPTAATAPPTAQAPMSYAAAAPAVVPPSNTPAPAPSRAQPYPASQPPANPAAPAPALVASAPAYASAGTPPAAQPPSGPAPGTPSAPPQTGNLAPSLPTLSPPLGLDGYCPVVLTEKQKWVLGDRRWGAIHRGRTYLFTGPDEQRRFFSDPDHYAPAVSGNDVVLAIEQGQAVAGMREHGVFFGNRVYLFSSEATLEKFARNPNLYANQALGAVRTGANAGPVSR